MLQLLRLFVVTLFCVTLSTSPVFASGNLLNKKLSALKSVDDTLLPCTVPIANYLETKTFKTAIKRSYVKQFSGLLFLDKVNDISIENIGLPKLNGLNFLYLYTGLIGLFFAIIIWFRKQGDYLSKILIGSFVLIHSLFILEAFLYFSNYRYYIPQVYMISSSVALLYGPILYFYFKRISKQYLLVARDSLHLIPTIILLLFLIPVYALPNEEKINIMTGSSKLYKIKDFMYIVFIPKVISLCIYGYLISRLHFNKESRSKLKTNLKLYCWESSIYNIHIIYLLSYVIYGLSISNTFLATPAIVHHIQIVAMSAMVVYIVCMSYVEPQLIVLLTPKSQLQAKYKNSGLTVAYSKQLKQQLLHLLEEEEIYKDNTLCLERLAERLNTTKHNASQIINEHFNMNFFELINSYRIHHAKMLFEHDTYANLKIIDVAYEIGFNNKTTFNKAFKQLTSVTPSQYKKRLKEVNKT